MSGQSLASRLAEPGPVLILDGGMGSMLLARGLAAGEAPERWNLERPEELVTIHERYVEAGSEAIHTNTFGANTIRLDGFGLADQCSEINQRAVELARRAEPRLVLADIGPTGEYLPPVGKAEPEAMRAAFLQQASALATAGVDGFHIETMSDLREALLALEAVQQAAPGAAVLVSLTFDRKRRGFFTVMGNAAKDAGRTLAQAGATAVGANCTLTSPDMVALARELVESVSDSATPVVIQANAGQPRLEDGQVHYPHDPEAFAQDAVQMARCGVRAIGGCCGTEPATISALKSKLQEPV